MQHTYSFYLRGYQIARLGRDPFRDVPAPSNLFQDAAHALGVAHGRGTSEPWTWANVDKAVGKMLGGTVTRLPVAQRGDALET